MVLCCYVRMHHVSTTWKTNANLNVIFSVICKLVFLQENERLGSTSLEDIPEEIDNLLPRNVDSAVSSINDQGLEGCAEESGWNALAVAREYNVRHLFDQFVDKLRCTLPVDCAPWRKPRDERDSLYSIACIQRTMLNGFIKRIDRQTSAAAQGDRTAQPFANETSTSSQVPWEAMQGFQDNSNAQAARVLSQPFSNFMNFDSINFDGITLPTTTFPPQGGEEFLGDLMWDMVRSSMYELDVRHTLTSYLHLLGHGRLYHAFAVAPATQGHKVIAVCLRGALRYSYATP